MRGAPLWTVIAPEAIHPQRRATTMNQQSKAWVPTPVPGLSNGSSPMNLSALLPFLSLFTLGAFLIAIVVGFAFYWRNRANRAPKDGGTPTEDGSV